MTTLEILKAARARIEDPDRWCQWGYARLPNGQPTHSSNPEAQCCAAGALLAVCRSLSVASGNARKIAREALCEAAGEDITRFNDTHTHAEVLALFDRAIATEEGKAVKS